MTNETGHSRDQKGTTAWVQQQIKVRGFDELIPADVEPLHESGRLSNPRIRGFVGLQNDFQLEKISKLLDAIQVNACPASTSMSSTRALISILRGMR
jgi:hypothetical protein